MRVVNSLVVLALFMACEQKRHVADVEINNECPLRADIPDTPVFAWTHQEDVYLVRNGEKQRLTTFTPPDNATLGGTLLQGNRGFVAAIRAWYIDGEWRRWNGVLVEPSGDIRWSRDGDEMPQDLVVGIDGTVAFGLAQSNSTLVFHPDGTQRRFDGVFPVSISAESGKIAARTPTIDTHDYFWLDPRDGAVEPFAYAVEEHLTSERGVVYLATVDASRSVVFEDGNQLVAVELPVGEEAHLGGNDQTSRTFEGPRPLVGIGAPSNSIPRIGWDDDLWRVDFSGGALEALHAPTDLWPLETRENGPFVDVAGGVYDIWRDAAQVGLRVTADGGSSWAEIGRAYTGINYLDVRHRSGTFVLESSDLPTFEGDLEWQSPPDEDELLTGKTLQIVRPADGVEWSTSTEGVSSLVSLSRDGICAATIRRTLLTTAWTLQVRNLHDSTELLLEGDAEDQPELWLWMN